ncbi:AAA family ATPase [Paraburkholderia nemoris]|uniref:AAA family ATPase n=1 Tax=Paraburkholderia nemoris TaxID=2793076 RepID=UPI0038BDD2E7
MRTNFWSNRGASGNGPVLEIASEIPILPIIWLWKFWLARGKLHLLAGPPATGKTTLALSIAATLSVGGIWPDGSRAPQGRVLIWTCEDGVEDTLMPRLAASGADLDNIYILRETSENGRRRPFDFHVDLTRLTGKVQELGDVVLVIIDSIAQIVSGNSNSNTQVRKDLEPVVVFAEQTGIAVLGLTHVTKGSKKKDPLERVNGSTAFGAVARVVLIVAPDESDRADDGVPRSVVVRAKSNLGPIDGGLAYHVEPVDIPMSTGAVESSRVAWDEVLHGSPKEILSEALGGVSVLTKDSRLQEAKEFLEAMLAAGPVAREVIRTEAERAGLAWATVRRASDELGVDSSRAIGEKHWRWSLHGGGLTSRSPKESAYVSGYTGPSYQAQRSIFDTARPPDRGANQSDSYVSSASGRTAAPASKDNEQVEQVGQVEQIQFEVDDAVWQSLVRICVNEYRGLRLSRPYSDEADECSVREEAIDDVLRETQASDAWKAVAKERLGKLNFVELAG